MTRLKNGKLRRKDGVWDPLKRSSADKQQADVIPKTPQSDSPSYRLAYADMDFLCREELRPVRLQLELLKTEMALTERGIKSTVVMFGVLCHHLLESLGISGNMWELVRKPYKSGAFAGTDGHQLKPSLTDLRSDLRTDLAKTAKTRTVLNNSSRIAIKAF